MAEAIPRAQDHRTGKPNPVHPILTIGLPVIDDHRGVSMTAVNLVNQLGPLIKHVEFVIVDNNPNSPHGHDTQHLASKLPNARYVGFNGRRSPFATKQACIEASETEYILVIDSHVLLHQGAIQKLLAFCSTWIPTNDLYHGPICTERFEIMGTHMNPLFGNSFGRWGSYRDENKQPIDPNDYYRIPMHGMGLFFCRRDAWPGFNVALHHFGCEEGYIHEKYRLLGRDVWSMPFLKWWHNFQQKSRQQTFSSSWEHKYRNGLISWTEVGLPLNYLHDAYVVQGRLNEQVAEVIRLNVESLQIKPMPRPDNYVPFLGYPIRIYDKDRPETENYRTFEKPEFYNSVISSRGSN